MSNVQKFFTEEEGATAIEYALIATLISVAIVVSVTAVGSGLNGAFNTIATAGW